VDIYPPTLHRAGLAAALCDLAKMYTARGIETLVDIPAEIAVAEPAERLLFRCAQETLRNTHKHAGAGAAWLTVCRAGLLVVMEVRDDGQGFDAVALDAARGPRDGHFGLSVLRDLVADAGGEIDIDARPGRGTTVRVQIPG
jgi:signal transduction histidine kinase